MKLKSNADIKITHVQKLHSNFTARVQIMEAGQNAFTPYSLVRRPLTVKNLSEVL